MSAQQKKRTVQLSEPDQVVAEYLQTLLNEVEVHQDQEPISNVLVAPVAKSAVDILEPKMELAEALAIKPDEKEVPQPVIPHWAKGPFQCLLFEINGLHLAVPLSELSSIAGKQVASTTHLLGQPKWHRGMLEHRGHKVGVIDIARLVMPGRLSTPKEQTVTPNHVLIMGGGEWGLMCDKLLSPILVEPDDVRWSCRHKNRIWMAGTLPDQLCIILDLDVLLTMLHP